MMINEYANDRFFVRLSLIYFIVLEFAINLKISYNQNSINLKIDSVKCFERGKIGLLAIARVERVHSQTIFFAGSPMHKLLISSVFIGNFGENRTITVHTSE